MSTVNPSISTPTIAAPLPAPAAPAKPSIPAELHAEALALVQKLELAATTAEEKSAAFLKTLATQIKSGLGALASEGLTNAEKVEQVFFGELIAEAPTIAKAFVGIILNAASKVGAVAAPGAPGPK